MNGQTIYHVVYGNAHHYFGSITAIYDVFTPEVLGVAKECLWSYGITSQHPYKNKKCTIYRGVIHRVKTKRGKITP